VADWLTHEQRSRNMSAIRSRGSKPEIALGVLLHELLPRRRIVEHPDLPGKPDYFLPGLKLAVFMDGCFWHGCPVHGRTPEDNAAYWVPKLERNRRRDRLAVGALHRESIRTVRVWEHELRGNLRPARRKVQRALTRAAP